jgi:hypothetical protein
VPHPVPDGILAYDPHHVRFSVLSRSCIDALLSSKKGSIWESIRGDR